MSITSAKGLPTSLISQERGIPFRVRARAGDLKKEKDSFTQSPLRFFAKSAKLGSK